MNAYVKTFSILATFSIAMIIASDARAQCSGGSRSGRGGGQPPITTGSTSQFASLYNQTSLLAYQRQLAYQQQQLAMQRQLSNEASSRLYAQQKAIQEKQQELYATRLARAEAKRAKRTERIAARKAERIGESSGSIVAATESRSTLVSFQDASPFH